MYINLWDINLLLIKSKQIYKQTKPTVTYSALFRCYHIFNKNLRTLGIYNCWITDIVLWVLLMFEPFSYTVELQHSEYILPLSMRSRMSHCE